MWGSCEPLTPRPDTPSATPEGLRAALGMGEAGPQAPGLSAPGAGREENPEPDLPQSRRDSRRQGVCWEDVSGEMPADKAGGFPRRRLGSPGETAGGGEVGKGKSPVCLAQVPRGNSPVGDGRFPGLLLDFHSWGLPKTAPRAGAAWQGQDGARRGTAARPLCPSVCPPAPSQRGREAAEASACDLAPWPGPMAWLSHPRWVPGGDTASPAAGARNFCSPRGPASAFPQGSAAPAAAVGLAAATPLPRADLGQPHEPAAGTAPAPSSAKTPEPGGEHTAAPSGWDQQGFWRGGERQRTCQPGSSSIFPWLHSAQVLLSDHRGHPVHPQPCCRRPWPRSLLQPGRAALVPWHCPTSLAATGRTPGPGPCRMRPQAQPGRPRPEELAGG